MAEGEVGVSVEWRRLRGFRGARLGKGLHPAREVALAGHFYFFPKVQLPKSTFPIKISRLVYRCTELFAFRPAERFRVSMEFFGRWEQNNRRPQQVGLKIGFIPPVDRIARNSFHIMRPNYIASRQRSFSVFVRLCAAQASVQEHTHQRAPVRNASSKGLIV